jgi:hypothetical protein
MKKIITVLLVGLCSAASAFPVDFTHGPETVKPGAVLINGALDLGAASVIILSTTLVGFTASVDYALPSYGLTIGGETGYSGGSIVGMSIGVTPFVARLGYHPDFGVKKLDAYGLFKMGMAAGFTSGSGFSLLGSDATLSIAGFAWGFGVGGRYFFHENVAAFAELGYDGYYFSLGGLNISAAKIFTIGVSFKP